MYEEALGHAQYWAEQAEAHLHEPASVIDRDIRMATMWAAVAQAAVHAPDYDGDAGPSMETVHVLGDTL